MTRHHTRLSLRHVIIPITLGMLLAIFLLALTNSIGPGVMRIAYADLPPNDPTVPPPPPTPVPPTPVPPTPVPPTPVPPTPIPIPTDTATPTVTWTATITLTPTLPPTSSATATLFPTATSSPTPTPPPTATKAPPAPIGPKRVAVQVALKDQALAVGQMMTATIRSGAKLHLRYTITFAGAKSPLSGLVQTNQDGLAVLHQMMQTGPPARSTSLAANCSIRIADTGSVGSANVHFMIYPALHLAVQAHLVQGQGGQEVQATVQLAAPASVSVFVAIPGAKGYPPVLGQQADGKSPVQINVPLGAVHGPGPVRVIVSVLTASGVTETRIASLSLPA